MALAALPDRPLVSVLVCNYNYERYVGAAIRSVLDQTYTNVEVVVCDDGSTDRSREVISAEASRDERVKPVFQENKGHAGALNAAFAASVGDICCLLDSDDLFVPHKLSIVVEHLRDGSAGMFIHRMDVIDPSGRHTQTIPLAPFERGWLGEKILRRGGRWTAVPTSGISFVRTVAEEAFPTPAERIPFADPYLNVLLPLLTTVAASDLSLTLFRRHEDSSLGGAAAGRRMRWIAGRGGENLTQKAVAKTIETMTKVSDAVALKVGSSPQLTGARFEGQRNLNLAEYSYFAHLLSGEVGRAALVAESRELRRRVATDDLYGARKKQAARVLYGVAPYLPVRFRTGWISLGFGLSSFKEFFRKILH
ncbi:MAG: hypothetical protein QOH90_283 [Actinomycetota bacterium]|nr:hypothetical protein [Actinomycetota bacterium]